MDLSEVLLVALNNRASDVHFKVGQPPVLRIDGELIPLKDYSAMDASEIAKLAYQIMNERQRERFLREMEIDMGYGISGMGRFRVNIFQQRGTIAIALRVIPFGIKGFEELNLPVDVMERIAREVRGLYHRQRQIDHPGRPHRHDQHRPTQSHHYHRGPHRVPPSRPKGDRQPARDRHGYR
jgi:twitching motility protein PilT